MFVSALLTALTDAAAGLLAVAGAAKLHTPDPAAAMLAGLWPRLRPRRRARKVARVAGSIELVVGLAAVVVGGTVPTALLAACYSALSVLAVHLATRAHPTSCGCFGAADGAVGLPHVLLDSCAAVVAATAVFVGPGTVADLFRTGVVVGVTSVVQAALLVALGYLSITSLPSLAAARRNVE